MALWRGHHRRAGGPGPDVDVPLVPYHHWANRGPATMRIWIPVTPREARHSN
ncbi:MAG: hypothetical protein WED83_08295 [Acidimicrobiia bacterium]